MIFTKTSTPREVEFVCETCGEVFSVYGRFYFGGDTDEFVPDNDFEVTCPNDNGDFLDHDVSIL